MGLQEVGEREGADEGSDDFPMREIPEGQARAMLGDVRRSEGNEEESVQAAHRQGSRPTHASELSYTLK